jgi:hypothetical protein
MFNCHDFSASQVGLKSPVSNCPRFDWQTKKFTRNLNSIQFFHTVYTWGGQILGKVSNIEYGNIDFEKVFIEFLTSPPI